MPSNNQIFTISGSGWTPTTAGFNNTANQPDAETGLVKKKTKTMKAPESSRTICTLQIPEVLLESSLESIDRELEERANALSEITRLLEVVQETDSLIQFHLSNLRKAASQSERKMSKVPPSYLSQFGPVLTGALETLPEASLAVAVSEWQFAPAPLPAGQG